MATLIFLRSSIDLKKNTEKYWMEQKVRYCVRSNRPGCTSWIQNKTKFNVPIYIRCILMYEGNFSSEDFFPGVFFPEYNIFSDYRRNSITPKHVCATPCALTYRPSSSMWRVIIMIGRPHGRRRTGMQ